VQNKLNQRKRERESRWEKETKGKHIARENEWRQEQGDQDGRRKFNQRKIHWWFNGRITDILSGRGREILEKTEKEKIEDLFFLQCSFSRFSASLFVFSSIFNCYLTHNKTRLIVMDRKENRKKNERNIFFTRHWKETLFSQVHHPKTPFVFRTIEEFSSLRVKWFPSDFLLESLPYLYHSLVSTSSSLLLSPSFTLLLLPELHEDKENSLHKRRPERKEKLTTVSTFAKRRKKERPAVDSLSRFLKNTFSKSLSVSVLLLWLTVSMG